MAQPGTGTLKQQPVYKDNDLFAAKNTNCNLSMMSVQPGLNLLTIPVQLHNLLAMPVQLGYCNSTHILRCNVSMHVPLCSLQYINHS